MAGQFEKTLPPVLLPSAGLTSANVLFLEHQGLTEPCNPRRFG